MRTVLFCVPAVVLFASPSLADDRTECRTGIEMIRSEIAKKPNEATVTKLQTALRVAEREDKEAEYDECLDAIKDARKALGR